jgi:hypothetical protein
MLATVMNGPGAVRIENVPDLWTFDGPATVRVRFERAG